MRSLFRFLVVILVFACIYHHLAKYGLPFGNGQDCERTESISDGGRRIDISSYISATGRTVIAFGANW